MTERAEIGRGFFDHLTCSTAITGHDCPWDDYGIERLSVDPVTRQRCEDDCAELRRIESSLIQHRLYLEGSQFKSINSANQMRRSLTAGESRARVIRQRMRVALGLDDPAPDFEVWEERPSW